jgi:PAS domain S-box-containing protein
MPSLSLEALGDSEARYRRLFETAQDGILILDAETGNITDVNPFLVKLLGFSHQEFLGKALWEIGLFRDIAASKEAFRELIAAGYVRYEDLPLRTKGGLSISVEFVSNVYRVNGKAVIQCNIRDVTARKRAERSEQLLRQSQKMETVGQLTAGIAHDFNNLLGVILGYCEVLEELGTLPEPVRKMIREIHGAGASAKDLTRNLLAFSSRQVSEPVLLDLNATVSRLHTMLKRVIGDDVELVSELGSDLGTIKADPIQIEQVLLNLAINSRDAMPHGGRITIKTANVGISEPNAPQNPSVELGRWVMLAVSDSGTGMDEKTQSHIFEPFFSTKESGKGTGLGLSTVFGIATQSSASIEVDSQLGRGTTFKVYFPRCDDLPVVGQRKKPTPIRGGSETILLVDDNDRLRELTRQLLEHCGYTVLDSGDPTDALRIAAQHVGPLPLMVTDVMMPGLCGPGLAKKLSQIKPETKVLYTSGCADDALFKRSDNYFLDKPYTRDVLMRKVREVLDLSTEMPSAQ